jgi:hypothetical protein
MSQTIEEYFAVNPDPYAPKIFKEELAQYDNYQIHDLYCNDIFWDALTIDGRQISPPNPSLFNNFLAVEKISLHGTIECNFEAIALAHP